MSTAAVLRCIFLAFLGGSVLGGVQAQPRPTLPSEHAAVAADALPVQQITAVDTAERPVGEGHSGIGPFRYGTVIETRLTPQEHGRWERLPSGHWLWRVRVQSTGARSLSLGFSPFDLPAGSRLFVHDGDGQTIRGPYTGRDATGGAHWTPLVQGEEVIVELLAPPDRRQDVHLVLSDLVHADRAVFPGNRSRIRAKSGSCNLDVACDAADPWRQQERSVALYSFEQNGSAYVCTGSLMNTTAQNGRPFFLTAEHCVSSPSVAQTMVFYWNYQNSTCRTPGTNDNGTVTADDRDAQISTGALLRFRYGGTHQDGTISGKPDLALVEVDDDIPTSYDLYFNGWSRAGTGTVAAATVHHPSGHGKRISFDREPTDQTAYGGGEGSGTTHLRVGQWDRGTTEGGSSGSPLYDSDRRVVGVLSGGLAGCLAGSAEDNDEPDWYGRIAPGFSTGDYTPSGFSQPATLADWLDPINAGRTRLEGRSQDSRERLPPPSTVTATTDGDSIRLGWAGVPSERVTKYRVYRRPAPIDSMPVAQALAAPVITVGAGTTAVVDTTLLPDTTYHYRVSAVDASNAESSFSAETRARIEGPGVHLVDGHSYSAPVPEPGTDYNAVGRFVLVADRSGAALTTLSVANEASGFEGVTAARLWRSTDRTFDAKTDTRLATTSTAAPAVFQDLNLSVPTDSTYLFVTLELASSATGEYRPVFRSEADISFSEGALAAVNGSRTCCFENAVLAAEPSPLPVALHGFTGRFDGSAVRLRWATASERNNARFRIQRTRGMTEPARGPGASEEARWRTVGVVDGSGTTAQAQTYRFTDADLPYEVDAVTYRLQQMDVDGTVHNSKSITVERGVPSVQFHGPAPNPARRRMTIRYALPTSQDIALGLFDVLGRRVRRIEHGEVPRGRHKRMVTLEGLSNGLYVLRLQTARGKVHTRKVTVVR
ncbi:hypothetical protein BSZ35_03845 [Salinibacter sp. 10B]|uniref:trypsin-like peptidase domain-containing protein n=1 Tax=Salinibacter sp. 10B TaxID=1923971 RepID=UPI000CF4596D|nr:trypsin-like peptidase domain-containing protein [Salinibacter sp. 10B]PQJ33851.1 hypothetical protein BSZ35_03845 [Salinibacter sp. 10B]